MLYLGIDLHRKQMTVNLRGEDGEPILRRQVSTLARYLLGQIVLHVLRKDAAMREWFRRIKKRRGVKIARVAVMRRLTVVFWHMLNKQQPYKIAASAVGPQRRTKSIPENV